MQPPQQPPSPRNSSRTASTPTPRRTPVRASRRPDHYEVPHRPRRVIVPGAQQEYSSAESAPSASPAESKNGARPRRASFLKKVRRVRFGPWEWAGLGVSVVASGLLLGEIVSAQNDHHILRVAVREKSSQLEALEKQQREDGKQLAYLKSEKGREQILASHGYVKPGDRILLFPIDKKSVVENPEDVKPDGESGAASTP